MKKILGLLLAMILAIGMCGCSSGTSSVKEYNIDEFLPTYRKILSSIEEKTQYWSEDELQSSKYTELFKKEAESGGFSLNQTIIIRGKVDTTYPSFLFISTSKNSNEDTESDDYEDEDFEPDSEDADFDSTTFMCLFAEKKDKEKGTKYISEYLSDCKIKSPDISKVKFADNVTDAIAVDGSERIMGTVNSIEKITTSDDDKEEYLESVDTSSDEYNYASAYRFANYVIYLNNGPGNTLPCFINTTEDLLPKEGDKISLIGEHFSYDYSDYINAENSAIYIFK